MSTIMGNELLEGKKVRLTAVQKDDIARYVELFTLEMARLADDEVVYPATLEQSEEWYKTYARDRSKGYFFAIRLKENNEYIGQCDLRDVHWQARHAEVGIVILDSSKWGQGYGTDAMRILLRYGFMELNLNRIFLGTVSFNARAIASYKKAGFREEARYREDIIRDGVYYDSVMMGILRDEWLKLQETT